MDNVSERYSFVEPVKEIQLREKFKTFVMHNCRKHVMRILSADATCVHHSLIVDLQQLIDYDTEISQVLLEHPIRSLEVFDDSINEVEQELIEQESDDDHLTAKSNVHVRLCNPPLWPELSRHIVPTTCDVGQLLAFSGTVIRIGQVNIMESRRVYQCDKCHHHHVVKVDLEQHYIIPKPTSCLGDCKSSKFTAMPLDPGCYRDYQEIKVQEQVQKLAFGKIPRSMIILLTDDLVDCCKPGDDLTVLGVVIRRWWPVKENERANLELLLLSNHISVHNEQKRGVIITDEMKQDFKDYWLSYVDKPLKARNNIVSSMCPQVFGLYAVKLSVLLVLIGGVQKTARSGGSHVRGESHLLLVGDPGTAKSQFLKFSAKLMPRSVLTSGVGSTSAGLTVTAIKDGAEWHLEAGALVLADGGLCCIDELGSIRSQDKASIHEPMEQQTISVAKAGMVCKLNTRCTVLAATNPCGCYDTSKSLSVNTTLASPLLSRFDIILVLLDQRNEQWDHLVSTFILDNHRATPTDAVDNLQWTLERLQAYIIHVKTINPVTTEPANQVMSKYYQLQRQTDCLSSGRTTVRLLESLVRLSQAHARLMMREEVILQDAIVAVAVMECSMQGSALLGNIDALHSSFPVDADEEYIIQEKLILNKLGLASDLQ